MLATKLTSAVAMLATKLTSAAAVLATPPDKIDCFFCSIVVKVGTNL